jgi:hypothetical protein
MAHHTVEDAWHFISGRGQMWRRLQERDEIVDVGPRPRRHDPGWNQLPVSLCFARVLDGSWENHAAVAGRR